MQVHILEGGATCGGMFCLGEGQDVGKRISTIIFFRHINQNFLSQHGGIAIHICWYHLDIEEWLRNYSISFPSIAVLRDTIRPLAGWYKGHQHLGSLMEVSRMLYLKLFEHKKYLDKLDLVFRSEFR